MKMTPSSPQVRPGYYHCLGCDSIFTVDETSKNVMKCNLCGQIPSLKTCNQQSQVIQESVAQPTDITQGKADRASNKVKVRKKRLSENKFFIQTAVVILGLILCFVGVKMLEPDEPALSKNIANVEGDTESYKKKLAAEKYRKLGSQILSDVYSQYNNASTVDSKLGFIYNRGKNLQKITKYYADNMTRITDHREIDNMDISVLKMRDPLVMGVVILDKSGELIDTQFVYQEDSWKLDWESYVCYNEAPWDEMLKMPDQSEGVYRLYLRTISLKGDEATGEQTLVFYPPLKGDVKQFSIIRPHIIKITKDSPIVGRMNAVLSTEQLGNPEYQELIKKIDPEGYQRVMVKLRLNNKSDERPFLEVVDFVANHWYGFDSPE